MVCMSALLLLAVSCKKDNEKLPEIEGAGFTATIELQDDGSKTHLVPGTNTSAVRWDVGDAIRVCSREYPNGFVFTSKPESVEADGITAHFFGTNIPDAFYKSPYTAFYGNNVAVSGGTYTLNVPATQNAVYNNNAFQNNFERGTNPMAARSDSRILEFKNICGMLELKLYSASDCYVDQIVLTATGGEKLNGNGTVTIGSDGIPSLGTLNGNSTITLNCGKHLLSKSSNNPSHFYFILPPVNLASGFSITVKEGTKVDTRTVSTAINIQRSHIKPMEKLAVTTEEPPIETPTGAVEGGVFTVNGEGKKVFFSIGNLTCNTNTNPATWSFYPNQTDYDHSGYTQNGGIISLFTWGYGTWSTKWDTEEYGSNFVDWGTNPITNGGNEANKWRTLSRDEMRYLLQTRTIQGRTDYGNTCVNLWVDGIQGLLVYNDGYTGELYSSYSRIKAIPAGCAFFPAAGLRWANTSTFGSVGSYANIWYSDRGTALSFPANEGKINTWNEQNGANGFCVRLVQDVP